MRPEMNKRHETVLREIWEQTEITGNVERRVLTEYARVFSWEDFERFAREDFPYLRWNLREFYDRTRKEKSCA